MKICPTCGDVYPESTAVCRSDKTALRPWDDSWSEVESDTDADLTDVDDRRKEWSLSEEVVRSDGAWAGTITVEDPPGGGLRARTPPPRSITRERTQKTVAPRVGRTLCERYALRDKIGVGGYGAVFDGFDERLRKRVAVKILSPAVAQDPVILDRFRLEAIAAGQIEHENIVDVRDFDVDEDGTHFIVMEYLDGFDLRDVADEVGALPPARALAIAAQCAEGLEAAHRAGIYHRDLKPANIYLTETALRADTVKIIDFGISKIVKPLVEDGVITTSSGVLGTPRYLAPERVGDGSFDARSEIYSLGVILYEMLVGDAPFTGPPIEVCMMQMGKAPVPPSQASSSVSLSEDLDALVLRAMEKRPENRYSSMGEFGEAILECLRSIDPRLAAAMRPTRAIPDLEATELTEAGAPRPTRASRQRWMVGGLAAAVAACGVLAYVALRGTEAAPRLRLPSPIRAPELPAPAPTKAATPAVTVTASRPDVPGPAAATSTPRTDRVEPRAKREKPRAKREKPRAKREKPRAKREKPRAKREKPRAKREKKPRAKRKKPRAKRRAETKRRAREKPPGKEPKPAPKPAAKPVEPDRPEIGIESW